MAHALNRVQRLRRILARRAASAPGGPALFGPMDGFSLFLAARYGALGAAVRGGLETLPPDTDVYWDGYTLTLLTAEREEGR